MQIVIHKVNKYFTHNFHPKELDNIKKICYDMGIKYYVINYNRSEQ
jgi:hypothetical protein